MIFPCSNLAIHKITGSGITESKNTVISRYGMKLNDLLFSVFAQYNINMISMVLA